MAYTKSYYERRVEEQARIREAIQNQVNPVVEQKPVVVVPDLSWAKTDIQNWLTDNGVPWTPQLTKKELVGLSNEKV